MQALVHALPRHNYDMLKLVLEHLRKYEPLPQTHTHVLCFYLHKHTYSNTQIYTM